MKIIAWIEQEQIVKKILKHVGLWVFDRELSRTDAKKRPLPRANSPPSDLQIDHSNTQVIYCGDYRDPDYSFDEYI